MSLSPSLSQIPLGEDSVRQFKADVRNAASLAAEMAAFANTAGGTIFIGVADDGSVPGLPSGEIGRLNQLISNAASQLVRSPLTVHTENIALENGRIVIVLTVPDGIDKPYFDKNGVIWLKSGADKRRVNSKEELRRLFQISHQFHADELPANAEIDQLDKLRFRDFLRDMYKLPWPESTEELTRLLQNMNLADDKGLLNLAGVLLFAERPEWILPQFIVKAIRYPGNEIHPIEYIDTEDFTGPLPRIFSGAIAFVMRNLHKVQNGRGVNAPGIPEISEIVFEELLVNALIHRDYMVSAPIRIFILDNRIEIISPGHLPNHLTVEKMKAGNSNIRNPILVSYAAKGLLPYHGLGSGIKRALTEWPHIEFSDDHEGCLFTARVYRKPVPPGQVKTGKTSGKEPKTSGKELKTSGKELKTSGKELKTSGKESKTSGKEPKTSGKEPKTSGKDKKTPEKILDAIRENADITIAELSEYTGVTERSVMRNIQNLRAGGVLRRIGGRRRGRWEIID